MKSSTSISMKMKINKKNKCVFDTDATLLHIYVLRTTWLGYMLHVYRDIQKDGCTGGDLWRSQRGDL